jgi:hypothetical protein
MAKVKVCRATGRPVDTENIEKFLEEFRRIYDKAARLCKMDMLRLNRKIAKVENILGKKYPTVIEVDFPNTAKKWQDHLNKYGPTIVTTMRDSQQLVLVIDDVDQTKY